jgi:hypothetical protein
VKLLVTSRAVLGMPGEHVVDIRPFPLPRLTSPTGIISPEMRFQARHASTWPAAPGSDMLSRAWPGGLGDASSARVRRMRPR